MIACQREANHVDDDMPVPEATHLVTSDCLIMLVCPACAEEAKVLNLRFPNAHGYLTVTPIEYLYAV